MFMCRSTCFGRLHTHHQEHTTALTASGFTLECSGSSVVGRGLAVWLDHDQQRCYHHAPTVKPEAVNPLNPKLNPICYLLALLVHHFLHISRIRVKSLIIRLLMSYIYGAPILDVSRSHTTTHHSR